MPLTSALLVSLVLASGQERVLLCRPQVAGDPAAARPEALAAAVAGLQDLFLDYGVPCETAAEAARAAGRAGLGHGVLAQADGEAEGARWLLVLTTAQEEEVARRALRVAPGSDAAGPLRRALLDLEGTVPRPPPRWPVVAGWSLAGAGVAALAVGVVFAAQARAEARRADAATTPEAWRRADDAWRRNRGRGLAAFAAGGGALAAGLTLRLAF